MKVYCVIAYADGDSFCPYPEKVFAKESDALKYKDEENKKVAHWGDGRTRVLCVAEMEVE